MGTSPPVKALEAANLPSVHGGQVIRVGPQLHHSRHGVEYVHHGYAGKDHAHRGDLLGHRYHRDQGGGDEGEYESVHHDGSPAPEYPGAVADRYRRTERGSRGYPGGVRVRKGVLQGALHRGACDGQAGTGDDTDDYARKAQVPDHVVQDVKRVGVVGRHVAEDVVPDGPVRLPESDGVFAHGDGESGHDDADRDARDYQHPFQCDVPAVSAVHVVGPIRWAVVPSGIEVLRLGDLWQFEARGLVQDHVSSTVGIGGKGFGKGRITPWWSRVRRRTGLCAPPGRSMTGPGRTSRCTP